MKRKFLFFYLILLSAVWTTANAQNLQQIWKMADNQSGTGGAWNTGSAARSAVIDGSGHMYVPWLVSATPANSKLYKIADNGATCTVSSSSTTNTGFGGTGIDIDEGGYLLIKAGAANGSAWTGLYRTPTTMVAPTLITPTLTAFNTVSATVGAPRQDFFLVKGNTYATTGTSYVIAPVNEGATANSCNLNIYTYSVTNSTGTPVRVNAAAVATAKAPSSNISTGHLSWAKSDRTRVLATYLANTNQNVQLLNVSSTGTLSNVIYISGITAAGCVGGAFFTVGGIEYIAYPVNGNGALRLFRPSSGYSFGTTAGTVAAVKGGEASPDLTPSGSTEGNGAGHVYIGVRTINANDVYLYEFASNRGAAKYRAQAHVPTLTTAPTGSAATVASFDVHITNVITGATYYYSLDGVAPVVGAANTFSYTGSSLPLVTLPGGFDNKVMVICTDTPGTTGQYYFPNVTVVQASYKIVSPGAPATTFSDPPSTYYGASKSVTLINTTPNVTIYYTTDGSTPTTSLTPYVPGTPITILAGETKTIKILTVVPGYVNSTQQGTFTVQLDTPQPTDFIVTTASPTSKKIFIGSNSIDVELNNATKNTYGVTLYYTTDGSTPTTSSAEYTLDINQKIVLPQGVTTIKVLAVAPGCNDRIDEATYYVATTLSSDFYVPNNPGNGKPYFKTLESACDVINELNLSKNITLWVNDDINSKNTGIVNPTGNFAITIKAVENLGFKPTITFNQLISNAIGSGGAFILGAKPTLRSSSGDLMNSTLFAAKKIRIHNIAIVNASTAYGANYPLVIEDSAEDIQVVGCDISNLCPSFSSGVSAIYLTTSKGTSGGVMPKNIQIREGSIVSKALPVYNGAINYGNPAYNDQGVAFDVPYGWQGGGIGVSFVSAEAQTKAEDIRIQSNFIDVSVQGIYMNNLNGRMEITQNVFHVDGPEGTMASGVNGGGFLGNSGSTKIYVCGNKFIKLRTACTTAVGGLSNYDAGYTNPDAALPPKFHINTGSQLGYFGVTGITHVGGGAYNATGNAAVWYIDNNYFSGFEKTVAGGRAVLQAIRTGGLGRSTGANLFIRHNTIYMNDLGSKRPTQNEKYPRYHEAYYAGIAIASDPTGGTTIDQDPIMQNNLLINYVTNNAGCPSWLIRTNSMLNSVTVVSAGPPATYEYSATLPNAWPAKYMYGNNSNGNNRNNKWYVHNKVSNAFQISISNCTAAGGNTSRPGIYNNTPGYTSDKAPSGDNSIASNKGVQIMGFAELTSGQIPAFKSIPNIIPTSAPPANMMLNKTIRLFDPQPDEYVLDIANPGPAANSAFYVNYIPAGSPAPIEVRSDIYNVHRVSMGGAPNPLNTTNITDNQSPTSSQLTHVGAFEIAPTAAPPQTPTGLDNLTSGQVRIECMGNLVSIMAGSTILSAKLVDVQGRVVDSVKGVAANVYALTAPGKGVYMVETQTESGRNVQKVVVR